MKTSIWLIAACLATSLHAQAASFKPVELKDTEMAELRGRYVMPGRIISFGIVMNSTWTSSNGGVVGASTSMYVQNTIEPKFYVSTYSSAGNGAPGSNGTGSVTGGAGLTTAQGVTQSVRAAGDNNSAYNNVDINVSEADQAPVVNQQGVLLDQYVHHPGCWCGQCDRLGHGWGRSAGHPGQQQSRQLTAANRPGWRIAKHYFAGRR